MLVEFFIAAIVMELTPGPNMTWLAMVAARDGRRAGFSAVIGITLGLALLAIASGLGVALLVSTYPLAYEVLRWAGVLYLLFLAYEAWSSASKPTAEIVDQRRYFWRGLIVNLLNPKAASVYVVLLPQFIEPTRSLQTQSITLALAYIAIATTIHTLIVLFAAQLHSFIAKDNYRKTISRIFSGLLVIVAIWFAYSTHTQV